jgi:hypothetical protein
MQTISTNYSEAPARKRRSGDKDETMKRWVAAFIAPFLQLVSSAAILTVTSGTDSTEPHSLRGAILEANRRGGNNIILILVRTNLLSIQGADENEGRTGDLDITGGRLTIIAARGTHATIDATGLGDRVFHILPRARAKFYHLIITGGASLGYASTAPPSPDGEPGGGILNEGSLLLEQCTIVGNTAGQGALGFAGNGGGIYNAGRLVLNRCLVAGNDAGTGANLCGGDGGGIYNADPATTVAISTILARNSAGSGGLDEGGFGGDGGDGGGIFNIGAMLLSQCAVAHNAGGKGADGQFPGVTGIDGLASSGGASGNGAGVYNAGRLRAVLSTISNNSCRNGGNGGSLGIGGRAGPGGSGAGLYNAGSAIAKSSQINSNSCGDGGHGGYGSVADGGDGGAGGNGGGIYNTEAALLTLTACAVTFNTGGSGGNGGNGKTYFVSVSGTAASGGAGGSGGGIFNGTNGTAILAGHTLVSRNSAGMGGQPGSFLIVGVTNIIGTTGANGTGPDLSGAFTER